MSHSERAPGESPTGSAAATRAGWQGTVPGALIAAFAAVTLLAERDLPGSSDGVPGPGTLPRFFSGVLLVLGAIIAVEGFQGPSPERRSAEPIMVIAVAVAAFEVVAIMVGIVPATAVAVAIVASHGMRPRSVPFAVVVLVGFVMAVAVALLGDALHRGT